MEDESKSKEELLKELEDMRRRLSAGKSNSTTNQQRITELLDSTENYRSILNATPN